MLLFHRYLELLPTFSQTMLSFIPTLSYFAGVGFYLNFHKPPGGKKPEESFISNSSKNMISAGLSNIFLSFPLFTYFSSIEDFRLWMIPLGMLMVDTLEFWFHYFYHSSEFLYCHFHKFHHKPHPLDPRVSFSNHDFEAVTTSGPLLFSFIFFQFSYYEYIAITTMAFVATVCDHTWTQKNKFHQLHHSGNKMTNFQQPFFTFWDHLMGTYNPNTVTKILFIP